MNKVDDRIKKIFLKDSPWRIVKCKPYVVLKKVDERIRE